MFDKITYHLHYRKRIIYTPGSKVGKLSASHDWEG